MKTIEEVRAAVDAGKAVHWNNGGYTVIKDSIGQYLIAWNYGGQGENFVGLGSAYFEPDFLKDNPFYVLDQYRPLSHRQF